MTNELFELARRRRSCRKYTGEKIPDEIVNEILKVVLLAPSSWGGHPIEFVVVANTSVLELWIEDAAVASTYILLAAEQFNVGACRIHIRNRDGHRERI